MKWKQFFMPRNYRTVKINITGITASRGNAMKTQTSFKTLTYNSQFKNLIKDDVTTPK